MRENLSIFIQEKKLWIIMKIIIRFIYSILMTIRLREGCKFWISSLSASITSPGRQPEAVEAREESH